MWSAAAKRRPEPAPTRASSMVAAPPAVERLHAFGGCRTSPASSGDMRFWQRASPSRSVARLRARARGSRDGDRFRRRTFAGGLWPPTLKRVLQGFVHARDPSGQVLLPTFDKVSIALRSRL